MSLPLTDNLGRVYIEALGTPVSWEAGVGYNASRQMCTTIFIDANDKYNGGWRMDAVGRVVVAAADMPNAVFNGGLPLYPSGTMMRQTDVVPAADDPYVRGIRVGTLGGVYFTSASPPSNLRGFSAGFSPGFK